jgi:hypothetical protein
MKLHGYLNAADTAEKEVTVYVSNGVSGVTMGARCTVIVHDEQDPLPSEDANERQPGE